ncbi:MAG: hypothetical protein ACRELB_25245 [Polyangiaceae bacterium]
MVFIALALVVACGSKSGGGGSCVDVSASNYDTSCQSASDCTAITAGHLCSPACICPNALINASGLAQWQKDVSGLTSATPCECPPSGAVPSCVSGTCAYVDVDAGSDAAAE